MFTQDNKKQMGLLGGMLSGNPMPTNFASRGPINYGVDKPGIFGTEMGNEKRHKMANFGASLAALGGGTPMSFGYQPEANIYGGFDQQQGQRGLLNIGPLQQPSYGPYAQPYSRFRQGSDQQQGEGGGQGLGALLSRIFGQPPGAR